MYRSGIEQMQAFKMRANSLAGYAWQAVSDLIVVLECVGFFVDCNIQ